MRSRGNASAIGQADLFAGWETESAREADLPFAAARTKVGAGPHLAGEARAVMTEDDMARRLEETGRYRILCQLVPRPVRPLPALRSTEVKIGVVLDTETTGLDHASDEIIELGMVAFTYDETGIRDVVGTFSALREPGVPISAEITRITSITAEMVAGQRIDLDAVARFAEPADLVIAHNARFDRPFVERFAPGFDAKPWACSVSEIDWTALGFEGTKLGYLVGQTGYFHNGHRAVDDCHALLEVLAGASKVDAVPAPFAQLLASATGTRLRIHAIGSPFETKDVLKARGYRWNDGSNGRPKCWWREILEDAYEVEARFLAAEIYRCDVEAHVERLTACERFKA